MKKIFLVTLTGFVSAALAGFAAVIFIIGTLIVILFSQFKKNDGKPYPLIGCLSQFWGSLTCFGLFVMVRVRGLEKVNPNKCYVFVGNHASFLDPIVLMRILPVELVTMAKEELKKVFLLGWGMICSRAIFVDRKSEKSRARAFKEAVDLLNNTLLSLYIFPSATRKSNDFSVTGPYRIAILSGREIVPVSLVNTREVWPTDDMLGVKRLIPARVVIGDPISTLEFKGDISNSAKICKLRDKVQYEIFKHL